MHRQGIVLILVTVMLVFIVHSISTPVVHGNVNASGVLFYDDFSSGNLDKWTPRARIGNWILGQNCQIMPWACNLEVENGALKLVATEGSNYSVDVIKDIFPTEKYPKYVLSFDWKSTVKETPYGLTHVQAVFYDSTDERLGIMTAQHRKNHDKTFEDPGLGPGRYGGVAKSPEPFDWERVTLDTTTAVPSLNMADVHRIHLRVEVYNDAGSGGDLYVDNFSFVGGSGDTGPVVEPPKPDTPDTVPPTTSGTVVSISPATVASPGVGQNLTLSLKVAKSENVAGYQATVEFDTTALRFVSGENGDFLPAGAFFVEPKVEGNLVRLNAASLAGESDGDGTLAEFTFEVISVKESTLTLSDVLLTDSAGKTWAPQIENAQITKTPQLSKVSISPATVASPGVGQNLTLSLKVAKSENVAGYQATVEFDTTALHFVSGENGDFLPAGAFFVEPKVEGNLVRFNAVSLAGERDGAGTLAKFTFEVITVKESTLTLSNVLLTDSAGKTWAPQIENAQITKTPQLKGDINGDGAVNIADLVLVAGELNKTGPNAADVNGDGVVNIADLVLVAGELNKGDAAPSLHLQTLDILTASDVRQWLSEAQVLINFTDTTSQRGVLFLQQLLIALTPKETALLANFPNPFNPETWIPYRLAKDAEVTLHIYAMNGTLVRTLTLGHQAAGMYQNRTRAAYWDGKNEFGEKVASGVYFYTLTTDDFAATRKMLIRK